MRPCTLALFTFLFLQLSYTASSQIAYPRFQKHTVLDGETAQTIAEQFNVTVSDFCLLNDFPKDVKLKFGQVVLVKQLKEGEKEIVEDVPLQKTKPVKMEAAIKPAEEKPNPAPTKTTTTTITEKPKPVETKKVVDEKPFVVPPPSTKAVEVGPGGTKYNVSQNEYHVVAKGQTFFRIALIYGLSVEELKELNGLTNTTIEIGQKLKVRR